MASKRKWSLKYKKSIDCHRPKGFSQKQHCKYNMSSLKRRHNRKSKTNKGGAILDLSEAKVKLEELNTMIRGNKIMMDCDKRCTVKMTGLSLDYVKDMTNVPIAYRSEKTDLLLCLNFEIGESIECLSSIALVVRDNGVVEIYSKTYQEIQGKKYNTLLRCVVMILAPLLSSQIKSIISNATNPISIYLLCRSFDGSITGEQYHAFKEENQITKKMEDNMFKTYAEFDVYLKQYQEYVKRKTGNYLSILSIPVECPVNEMTQAKNEESFIQFLESIKCICD